MEIKLIGNMDAVPAVIWHCTTVWGRASLGTTIYGIS